MRTPLRRLSNLMRMHHLLLPFGVAFLLAFALSAAPAFAEAPTVGSETATGVKDTSVTFEATIDPRGIETAYEFQYATDEALTENTGSVQVTEKLPETFEELPVGPLAVTGLQPHTVYFYRAVATNTFSETTDGSTRSFLTLAKPAVTVEQAEEVSPTTARIFGTVNPGGAPASYTVVYVPCPKSGCEFANAESTPAHSAVSTGYAPEEVGPITLEELKPGTVYHYTITATNPSGTTVGPEREFTTSPPTPSSTPETAAPTKSAPVSTPTFTLPQVFSPVPFTPIATLIAKEAKDNGVAATPATRAEKLTKALRSCKNKHSKKRQVCERQAHHKYAPPKKHKK